MPLVRCGNGITGGRVDVVEVVPGAKPLLTAVVVVVPLTVETLTTGTVENTGPLNSRAVIAMGMFDVKVSTPTSGRVTATEPPMNSFTNLATCCMGPIVKGGK